MGTQSKLLVGDWFLSTLLKSNQHQRKARCLQ